MENKKDRNGQQKGREIVCLYTRERERERERVDEEDFDQKCRRRNFSSN